MEQNVLEAIGVVCGGALLVIGVLAALLGYHAWVNRPHKPVITPLEPWRAQIKEQLKEEAAREEKEKEAKRKQEEKESAEHKKLFEEQFRRTVALWAKENGFQCHCCRAFSTLPLQDQVFRGSMEESFDYEHDWSAPNDLVRCTKCHLWTCANCHHLGICKDHAK